MRSFALLLCTLFTAPLWAQSAIAPTARLDAATVPQPEGWADDLALTIPEDLNPDPNILEINLEAVIRDMEIMPGKLTPVWTYNGVLPGPLIKVKVGDRVIVHFKNSLPEDTSIHWHGLRISNDMDGVPGFTMDPVRPQEEFTYDFVVPDAGTFWYHPHVDNSAAQMGWGLYGPLIVEDPNEPQGLGDELILVFSDMSLNPDGQFEPADSGGSAGNLFGREGTVLLVNGKVQPTLKVRQGKPQRWRIINATRSRYYTLRYKRAPLVKLGGDGGLAARPETVDEIKLVPSERLDLVFTPPDAPGTLSPFRWYATNRGYGSTYYRVPEDILLIQTVDAPPVQAAPVPAVLRQIEPIDLSHATEREINLTIAFDRNKKVVMGINGIPNERAVPVMVKVGDTEIWTIRNDTDFSHPFHMHGYFFQVLDDERIPQWKDSVDVPFKSSLRIAVHFDGRPGMWMYHCHILDHAEAGMMGHIHVMPAD